MTSIPASALVAVQPNVLGTGGSPLSLNALLLTQSPYVPIGTVVPLTSLADAQAYFGFDALETTLAMRYFLGFDDSDIKPSLLYVARHNPAAVGAWLRGATLKALNLAQLKAITGDLSVTVDGAVKTGTINLSAVTSFSQAAQVMATALGVEAEFDALHYAFVIKSATTGLSSTLTPATGSTADLLGLSAQAGAVVSQGAAPAPVVQVVNTITQLTQNWATVMTAWEPDLDTKLALATWANSQNQRYLYVCWDTDTAATVANSEGCFGQKLKQAAFDGTVCVYKDPEAAAFVCGTTASIDFTSPEGRITYAYKGQSGLATTVTDAVTAKNLIDNGYNFYGSYATSTALFQLFQPGQKAGKWRWIDNYVNQIYLNSQLQLALLTLLKQVKSLPYNLDGYTLLRAAAQDPINQMLAFGAIRAGVVLSESQRASINQAAGRAIASSIESAGYHLQILPATAQVRTARGSPPMKLWYTDGGSIHTINLASIDVQ